jgi:hypothetical protein
MRQKRRFHFSHCELSIYMWQHSNNTSISSIYNSLEAIFQSIYFLRIPLIEDAKLKPLNQWFLDLLRLLSWLIFTEYFVSLTLATTHMFRLS